MKYLIIEHIAYRCIYQLPPSFKNKNKKTNKKSNQQAQQTLQVLQELQLSIFFISSPHLEHSSKFITSTIF